MSRGWIAKKFLRWTVCALFSSQVEALGQGGVEEDPGEVGGVSGMDSEEMPTLDRVPSPTGRVNLVNYLGELWMF